ncbi:MAG TPA: hypothetical protein VK816_08220 [Jatrophihabitantaceae bacterium]|nr:hypothetical protein [Jatrophihabitantaceae bacterium]
MTARRVIALLLVALAAYFVLIGYRGVYLLTQSRLDLKVLGVAVLVLPLVGIWVVVAELRFGGATQRLAELLDVEGAEPEPELARTPAGRVDRAAADALFERCRAEVEAAPADWRGWYRLALAYDLAGDRRRARGAMRDAIERAPG